MNLRFLFSLLATSGLTVATALGADAPANDVSLYLSPDATQPVYAHLKSNDAAITNATPVLDPAKVTEGWRTAVLAGPVTGYVSSKTVHKDMSITRGTPVHVAPDEKSAVLGETSADPLLNIKSPGLDWSEVSFPGPVTAYFINAGPKPPVPTVTATVAPTPAPTPAPTVNAAPTRLTPASATGTQAAAVTTAPAAKQADAADVAHYYYGVLKQRTNLNIRGPTNAQYVLYSDKNMVLALVDLNEAVLPNPIVTYLNKSVKIYGTAYTDSSLPFAVIHALVLQTN